MRGLVHIYCGDGKGKTTAATGLAVRARGADMRVLFAQFAKEGTSSEVEMLRKIGVEVRHDSLLRGWYRSLSPAQREEAAAEYINTITEIFSNAENWDLIVLDEIMAACNNGLVAAEWLAGLIKERPEHLEIVLTGRNPPECLLELAEYVSEIKKIRHPYENGISSRKGIER